MHTRQYPLKADADADYATPSIHDWRSSTHQLLPSKFLLNCVLRNPANTFESDHPRDCIQSSLSRNSICLPSSHSRANHKTESGQNLKLILLLMRFVWILWFDIFSFLSWFNIKFAIESAVYTPKLPIILSFLIKAENKIVDDADKALHGVARARRETRCWNCITSRPTGFWDAANVAGHCDLSEMSLLTNITPGRRRLVSSSSRKIGLRFLHAVRRYVRAAIF